MNLLYSIWLADIMIVNYKDDLICNSFSPYYSATTMHFTKGSQGPGWLEGADPLVEREGVYRLAKGWGPLGEEHGEFQSAGVVQFRSV